MRRILQGATRPVANADGDGGGGLCGSAGLFTAVPTGAHRGLLVVAMGIVDDDVLEALNLFKQHLEALVPLSGGLV